MARFVISPVTALSIAFDSAFVHDVNLPSSYSWWQAGCSELIIVVDDGDRVTERIAGTDVSTDCLLQGFQVRIDLDLLRVLSRCDLQHRQGVLFLFHAYPPQI